MKKAGRNITEKYYSRLTTDFHTNKKVCEEVAVIPSKRLRNKIAGFVTRLMGRIQRGPVRGISLKLQEEERERKDNYIPDQSALNTKDIKVDQETKNMLRALDFGTLAGVSVESGNGERREWHGRKNHDRKPAAAAPAPAAAQ